MTEAGEVPWSDPVSLEYHDKQWATSKASTLDFIKQIANYVQPSAKILDVGCGGGAATYEISQNFPSANFHGMDLDPHLIEKANSISSQLHAPNVTFGVGDVYNLKTLDYDGVISLQTLSWLPDYEHPMKEIFHKIRPKWVGLTSLFFQGDITAITTIHEHVRSRSVNYNTYSLPRFSAFCESSGYKVSLARPFIFPFDIGKPLDLNFMGTYTLTTLEQSQRIQVSGPLLMNWMTLVLQKI